MLGRTYKGLSDERCRGHDRRQPAGERVFESLGVLLSKAATETLHGLHTTECCHVVTEVEGAHGKVSARGQDREGKTSKGMLTA